MGISDESDIGSRVSIQVVHVTHNLHLLAHEDVTERGHGSQ